MSIKESLSYANGVKYYQKLKDNNENCFFCSSPLKNGEVISPIWQKAKKNLAHFWCYLANQKSRSLDARRFFSQRVCKSSEPENSKFESIQYSDQVTYFHSDLKESETCSFCKKFFQEGDAISKIIDEKIKKRIVHAWCQLTKSAHFHKDFQTLTKRVPPASDVSMTPTQAVQIFSFKDPIIQSIQTNLPRKVRLPVPKVSMVPNQAVEKQDFVLDSLASQNLTLEPSYKARPPAPAISMAQVLIEDLLPGIAAMAMFAFIHLFKRSN